MRSFWTNVFIRNIENRSDAHRNTARKVWPRVQCLGVQSSSSAGVMRCSTARWAGAAAFCLVWFQGKAAVPSPGEAGGQNK